MILRNKLLEQGGELEKFKFTRGETGQVEAVATEDISAGEILLVIPNGLAIDSHSVHMSTNIAYLEMNDLLRKLNSEFVLTTIQLLEERASAYSVWQDSYAMFEKDFAALPLFYSEKELDYLKGSDLYAKVQQEQRDIFEDYSVIVRAIPDFGYENSIQDFYRAYSIAQSGRLNKISESAFVQPLVDLFSYSD